MDLEYVKFMYKPSPTPSTDPPPHAVAPSSDAPAQPPALHPRYTLATTSHG
jgi:hypothetical protein